jgi:flagellin-specific chaperone FliS
LNNGSIDMLYQGDMDDIDPQSSTARLVDSAPDDSGLAARVRQELRITEQSEQTPRQPGANGHPQPEKSSSRLTDMLNGINPGLGDFQGRFKPNCPSAVPSPLHKLPHPDPTTPMQAIRNRPESGLFGPVVTPKTIHDHFFMTNEHLDVLGKSTWDQIELLKKEVHEKSTSRHEEFVAKVEELIHDIKMQVDSVNEKIDRNAEQGHNIDTKLEKLFDFLRDEVVGALAVRDQKMTDLEQSVKEVHKIMQTVQRMLEQKHTEPNVPLPGTFLPPGLSHRSQPSLAGYYGNMTESGRESQPPMPHMEARWGPRGNFQGRNGREERPYPGTNPYQFANGTPNGGGQFSNGYSNGYPNYDQ